MEKPNFRRKDVVGRFAPSPSGLLHQGSLVTAVASYLQAKSFGGSWLLRIEDVDTHRQITGAAQQILFDLERLGFEWDGNVEYQSTLHDYYQQVLRRLEVERRVYRCDCSRKQVQSSGVLGVDGYIYNGHCREGVSRQSSRYAWRLKISDQYIKYYDHIQGWQSQNLATEVGDFVLLRADGVWAYQLAVVVDDARQGVNQVVRGSDLLDSTPRQIYLQQLLGFEQVDYFHIPVVSNRKGEKLSKQTQAPALQKSNEVKQIYDALLQLNQNPPSELQAASLGDVWAWARQNWSVERVPQKKTIPMLCE